ncbi:B-cell receptor CD22 [Myripristis murdjan]|uniref:B-cell receptor CD22 n=1 Tax=Myripristis murdjan TaxID=586833 RepID=UPI001176000A|nr:B-cell receptor CD22-like [Myripristis murdjan]
MIHKMKASTCRWLVFLAITIDFSCSSKLFETFDTHLRAKEGSCIEIRCTGDATQMRANEGNAVWYWIKNAEYHETNKNFTGTVIYSTTPKYPVSQEFEGRVEYLGSQSFGRQSQNKCGIRINNLQKTDSGNYSFRYEGAQIWMTNPRVNLTVEENPCKITFEEPPTVKESGPVTLKCSTSSSCRFRPQIKELQLSYQQDYDENLKVSRVSFMANGQDDGRTFTCQLQDKRDNCLAQSVRLTVEHSPRNTEARKSPEDVKEGDIVTLTCSTRGRPDPAFSWFKDGTEATVKINVTGAEWKINSITASESGTYYCVATNKYGTDRSATIHIDVKYAPRNSKVSRYYVVDDSVKIREPLSLTCNTEAFPEPQTYSWYHNSHHKLSHSQKDLRIDRVDREDHGCYICSATNIIGPGTNSSATCIKVLFQPTNLTLWMPSEATEGQNITISCTTESFPLAQLTLSHINSNGQFSSTTSPPDSNFVSTIKVPFEVTPDDAGRYLCKAKNSEGSDSTEKELVVKYRPKNVLVSSAEGKDGPNVREKEDLVLKCKAESNPPVTSYTWRTTAARTEELEGQKDILTLRSVTPSHSGLYSCTAHNDLGTGKSQEFEVKVMYAPKDVKIDISLLNWKSPANLSCRCHSFPAVSQYQWYKITEEESDGTWVSSGQNYTVSPDKPGMYYCTAKNQMGLQRSESQEVFLDRGFLRFLPIILFFLFGLVAVLLLGFLCRQRRNKPFQQGASNTRPCWGIFGFLVLRNGTRENLVSENGFVGPCRSRDDLLPDRRCRPQPQPCRPRPDSTPASNISTVYCTVNLPKGKQGPSQPARGQDRSTEDDAVNYASLHFGEQKKNRPAPKAKAGEEDVYAKVVKPKPRQKDAQGKHDVYENIGKARAQKQPVASNFDSDSSEEDVEINYSVVNFKAKSGNQGGHHSRTKGYSSSDEEDKTQYSEVRI